MLVPFTNLKAQYTSIKEEIDRAIESVLEGGQFIGGKQVEEFEAGFGALHNVSYCVAVGNGTDAIFIALKNLNLKHDDEVIVPAFGWISASEMVTLAGGVPVFCDVLPSATLNPALIEQKITARTKGIILIHLYGQAGHAHAIKEICDKNHLFLIEDCAQAHLTSEYGISAGSIGAAGTFSFYPTKNLGAYGDGGCILTSDAARASSMRLFANHGGLHRHEMEGINSRLDSLQAAVLTVKCRHITRWTQKRIEHAGVYTSLLSSINEISLPFVRERTVHTFHQYVIRTPQRAALKSFLEENGIQTLIHYPLAIPALPAYRHLNFRSSDFPEAARCQDEVLSLPIFPEISSVQIVFVCEKIKTFFANG